MISLLHGIFAGSDDKAITVMVGDAVGFDVVVHDRDRAALAELVSQHVRLLVTTVWNEASGPRFFGFLDARDKRAFERMIQIEGVGPVAAMRVLGALPADDIVTAPVSRLRTIRGIGPKLAERLAKELAA